MATPMPPAPADLDKLIEESQAAIKRLEGLQQSKGGRGLRLGQRLAGHIGKHGSHLINVMLAGSVLAVAGGRLSQKYEFQSAREEWEQQRQQLVQERQAAQQQLSSLQAASDTLVGQLEQAAAGNSGRQLAGHVIELAAAFRFQQQQHLAGGAAAAAAAAHHAAQPPPALASAPQEQQQPPTPQSDGGGKVMF